MSYDQGEGLPDIIEGGSESGASYLPDVFDAFNFLQRFVCSRRGFAVISALAFAGTLPFVGVEAVDRHDHGSAEATFRGDIRHQMSTITGVLVRDMTAHHEMPHVDVDGQDGTIEQIIADDKSSARVTIRAPYQPASRRLDIAHPLYVSMDTTQHVGKYVLYDTVAFSVSRDGACAESVWNGSDNGVAAYIMPGSSAADLTWLVHTSQLADAAAGRDLHMVEAIIAAAE